jgi:hypothetical protein
MQKLRFDNLVLSLCRNFVYFLKRCVIMENVSDTIYFIGLLTLKRRKNMRKKFKLPIVVLFSCLIATSLGACDTTSTTSITSEDETSQVVEQTTSAEATSEEETTSVVVITGTVAVAALENGTIVPDITSGEIGTIVTLTVTPDEGYSIGEVKANDVSLTEDEDGNFCFALIEGENEVTGTFAQIASLSLDKTAVEIDEVGTTAVVVATPVGSSEAVIWTALDETIVSLAVSEDTNTCTITSLQGGSTVVKATLGSIEKMVTVQCSSYGDVRTSYTIFDADGVEQSQVKGFYNALDIIYSGDFAAVDGLYVTAADDTETVLYVKDAGYAYNYINKEGTYYGVDSNDNITNGKSGWFGSYQTVLGIDNQTEFSMYQNTGDSSGKFLARPTNFDSAMFSDGYTGYSNAGNPGTNIWSGWRSSLYSAAITTVEFVTWADPYSWNEMDLSFDLSDSLLTPSYNAEQGTFAQIYLGSSFQMQNLYGVYFDAGTMDSCSDLVDGATRGIYTFEDKIVQSGGLSAQQFDTTRAIGTTEIGQASWDAFNKCWSFPDVTVELNVLISYTGEDANDAAANYTRNYEISGFNGVDKVASVSYLADYGSALARSSSSERSIYGVSLTPDWVGHAIADITNGSSWTNVVQSTSMAYNIDGTDQNLQFTAGRTVNGGNQTGLYGSDCVTASTNKNDQSVFDFIY